MSPKFILVLGIKRSGTSFVARCLADAGIRMWNRQPTTDHWECPEMIEVMDEQDSHRRAELFRQWKENAELLGTPCGCKEPRLIMRPLEVTRAFPPDQSLYVICNRDSRESIESLSKLASHTLEYSHDCIVGARLVQAWWESKVPQSLFVFDYHGDMRIQGEILSAKAGREIPIARNWKPELNHSRQ